MTGDGTKTGRWGGATAVAGADTGADMGASGECRVTVGFFKLAPSGAGYSAWTNTSATAGTYTKHPGDYCDCTGKHECNKWAFHATVGSASPHANPLLTKRNTTCSAL